MRIKKVKSMCHPEALAKGSCEILHCVQNESGRSMVEMLGVLAVIGVLSVAGISGYSVAMRSHRANEAINAASMLYISALAKEAATGITSASYTAEFGNAPSGISEIGYSGGAISITFSDQTLCTQVKNKLGDKAGECNAGTLKVTFGETCRTNPSICTAWQKCEHNECVCDSTTVATNHPCPSDPEDCENLSTIVCSFDEASSTREFSHASCTSDDIVLCRYN